MRVFFTDMPPDPRPAQKQVEDAERMREFLRKAERYRTEPWWKWVWRHIVGSR